MSRVFLGAATLALAAAFTVAPTVFAPDGLGDAAYAKGGNGKGGDKGNGKEKSSSNGGGASKAASSGGGNRGQQKKAERTASASGDDAGLAPNQKGRWNAAHANQAALDAHIRNGNFNGTIGALSQYQLAAKAASGAELTPEEQAALDGLVGEVPEVEFTDDELETLLNGESAEGAPVFDVVDGQATCVANCDAEGYDPATIDGDANAALAAYREAEQAAAEEQAVRDFYDASEQRILDESNKPTDGIEDQLLDEIAADLGVTRPAPEPEVEEPPVEDDMAGGDPAGEDPILGDDELPPPPPLL